MIAWSILKHAFRMIFFDFGALARAIAPGVGLFALAILVVMVSSAGLAGISAGTGAGWGIVGAIGGLLLAIYAGLMIVVTWHRYVLLTDEARAAGLTPAAGPIFSYLGRTLLICLALMVPTFALLMVIGASMNVTGGAEDLGPSALAGSALGLITLSWLGLRMSLILPAAAIEKPMALMESWRATAPLSFQILLLVLALLAINFGLGIVVGFVEVFSPILATLMNLVVSLFATLLGASVLTTLYGHLVEGRALPE